METMKSMKPQKQVTPVHIRWMVRRDMPEVLAIESECFDWPWEMEDFVGVLQQRDCLGMVAEHGDRVVGFMIYQCQKRMIEILNFAVAVQCRRRGVGSQMADQLKAKLSRAWRWMLTTSVRESNLAAQLFFRAQGFRARGIARGEFTNGEDAYRFTWRLPAGDDQVRG